MLRRAGTQSLQGLVVAAEFASDKIEFQQLQHIHYGGS
jgi:hypothetical protein